MLRTVHYTDLGDTAVLSFFFISGYLILKSAVRWASPEEYVAARFLRIFPGLAVIVLLSMFVLGPIVTSFTTVAYFKSKLTFAYLNVLLLNYVRRPLPGVFEQNRFSNNVVNGALRTLPVEWTMYVGTLLGCIAVRWKQFSLNQGWRGWSILLASLFLTLQMMPLPWVFLHWWVICYLIGSACYLLRQRVPLSIPLASLALAANLSLVRVFEPHMSKYLYPILLCYLVLALSYHPAVHVRSFHRFGDYSYGLYIYAWPLQQVLAPHFVSPLKMFAVCYPLTLSAAILSWRLIEKPSLSLKNRLRRSAIDASLEKG